MKRRTRRKLKYKNIILLIVLLASTGIFIRNIIIFINWKADSKEIAQETKEATEISAITEIEDTEEIEIINPPENLSNDYFDYVKLPLINVDITELQKINKDTVGFISVGGTNINYPVVQTRDNNYYLNHSFQNNYNQAGWIFMDYRNSTKKLDKNTIIYGHGRLDETMLGSLKNILNTSWINNKNNYVVRYVTESETMLFQVFSVYTIQAESYYIKTEFISDSEYKKWLDTMIGRSKYNFNTTVNVNDIILTLSTCKDTNNNRIVMQAKLIKKDKRMVQ